MARVDDLRSDYDALGRKLSKAEGAAAAAIVRERRALSELLESLERPKVVPKVDELAARRTSRTGDTGAATRRRKSG